MKGNGKIEKKAEGIWLSQAKDSNFPGAELDEEKESKYFRIHKDERGK